MIERRSYVVSDVLLPGRGEVVMIHAGPLGPTGPRRRWEREVQVLVAENGRAQVWVDGVEVLPWWGAVAPVPPGGVSG